MDFLEARRSRIAQLICDDDILLIVAAGTPIPIPGGLDQVYDFRPHPDYFWLTDLCRPGGVVTFDRETGWRHFVVPVSEAEQVWEGKAPITIEHSIEELPRWVEEKRRAKKFALCGAALSSLAGDGALSSRCSEILLHARRNKDPEEVARVCRAVRATATGFEAVVEFIAPGRTEREIKLCIEDAMLRAGGERMAYDTIVGSGPNSAVLHFPPGHRSLKNDELVLIDAGCDIGGYVADVTRVYPSNGALTGRARALYDLVLSVQEATISRCTVGVEWCDVHASAATGLCQGLIDLKILRGRIEERLADESISLFLPHGIGHMVGYGVRDASGTSPGRSAPRKVYGSSIRADLPLQPGYLMTVEPGLYFIGPLLNDPVRRARYAGAIDWEVLKDWMELGGVRIEDNILITSNGPQNLTAAIPK